MIEELIDKCNSKLREKSYESFVNNKRSMKLKFSIDNFPITITADIRSEEVIDIRIFRSGIVEQVDRLLIEEVMRVEFAHQSYLEYFTALYLTSRNRSRSVNENENEKMNI